MAAADIPPAKRARVEKEPLLVDDILALEVSKHVTHAEDLVRLRSTCKAMWHRIPFAECLELIYDAQMRSPERGTPYRVSVFILQMCKARESLTHAQQLRQAFTLMWRLFRRTAEEAFPRLLCQMTGPINGPFTGGAPLPMSIPEGFPTACDWLAKWTKLQPREVLSGRYHADLLGTIPADVEYDRQTRAMELVWADVEPWWQKTHRMKGNDASVWDLVTMIYHPPKKVNALRDATRHFAKQCSAIYSPSLFTFVL